MAEKKLTQIFKEDAETLLQFDDNGVAKIPDGFTIIQDVDDSEAKALELAQMKSKLERMPIPSDEELIELGRSFHPYYQLELEVEQLKAELDESL